MNNRVSSGGSCLLNFEITSSEYLQKLFPNVNTLQKRTRILEDLCIGPTGEAIWESYLIF